MTAHLTRIEQVNPVLNAIVTLLPDSALAEADAADAALAHGDDPGPLCGLPVAHKDLFVTAGIRTTFGSLAFEHHVPDETALIVERERRAGAITLGKTNTPEFGAGSQTFNAVFGATRNPYDPTKTCGGSSGGAAAALAAGMVPIADGSDLGGSLRNPASFCNVVGFRSSPGRVPRWPSAAPWFPFDIHGPMARTVADVALVFDAIAGPDARAPLSLGIAPENTAGRLERDFSGTRIGWTADLGTLPVEPAVTAVFNQRRATFEDLGCLSRKTTGPICPGLTRSSPRGAPGSTTWRSAPPSMDIGRCSRTPSSGTSKPAAPSAARTSPPPNAPGRRSTTGSGDSWRRTSISCCRWRRWRRSRSNSRTSPPSTANRCPRISTG